jgi:hypothetical protein
MHLDHLIHGLFITKTQFRLSTTFILGIIIDIHITGNHSTLHSVFMYTLRLYTVVLYPYSFPFDEPLLFPFLGPLYLLGTLLAVTGSVHPGPRLLVN